MSILAKKSDQVLIQGGPAGVNAAKRMAEFRFLIGQPHNVPAFVFPPDAGEIVEIPYGSEFVSIPVYGSVEEAVEHMVHPFDSIEPKMANHAIYEDVFGVFKDTFLALRDGGVYDKIAAVQNKHWG